MEQEIFCLVCLNKSLEYLYEKSSYTIYRCPNCTTHLIFPLPSDEEIMNFYADDYSSGYIKNKAYKQKEAKKIIRRINKKIAIGNLLEIGASAGFNLAEAQSFGWKVYGTEYSDDGIAFAKQSYGIELFKGDLSDAYYPDNYFDAIIAYNVIEHIKSIHDFMREIQRIAKPGCIVEIQTCKTEHIIVQILKQKWKAYKPVEHIIYFTTKSLTYLFEKYEFALNWTNNYSIRDTLYAQYKKL